MDIQRLRYFLAVARQKNFSRAAASCRVAQPSLSQQIKKLEAEVGGPLFLRGHGPVKLSALGQAFLRHAQAIMAEVQAAEEFADRTQQATGSTIRLGAIPTLAPYLIPRIIAGIREDVPAAKFQLLETRTGPLIENLLSGEIDFALLSPPTRIDEDCEHLTLLQDELLLTLPSAHPLAKAKTITAPQIRGEPIVLLENAHCLAGQTAAYCEEIGLTADVHLRGSQIDTLLGLVEAGLGLTFTPALASAFHPHRKVVFRRLTPQPCFREVRIVWLRRQFLTRALEDVIKSVRRRWR